MSYAVPRAKPRPAVVTAAVGLLFFLIAVHLVSLIPGIAQVSVIQDVVADEPSGPTANAMQIGATVGIAFAVVIALVLIACYAVLGVFVAKGKQVARIITWVVAGIFALNTLVALAGGTAALTSRLPQTAAGSDLQARVKDATPSWIGTATLAINAVTLIALLCVFLLLALPAANDYFRKPPVQWPPVGGPYPYYPPAAGYQPYPPVPPVPTAPGTQPYQPDTQLRPAAPQSDIQQPD
jgi:hypothetical protein